MRKRKRTGFECKKPKNWRPADREKTENNLTFEDEVYET